MLKCITVNWLIEAADLYVITKASCINRTIVFYSFLGLESLDSKPIFT